MAKKLRRLEIRCADDFLAAIDDWRAAQRPVLSQAAAIRKLTLRGAAVEKFLNVILRTSAEDFIRSGAFATEINPEIYERWKHVMVQSLDQAAAVLQDEARSNAAHRSGEQIIRETHVPYKFAPKRRRGFP